MTLQNLCSGFQTALNNNASAAGQVLECHILAGEVALDFAVISVVLGLLWFQWTCSRRRRKVVESMFEYHEYIWCLSFVHILSTLCLCAESAILFTWTYFNGRNSTGDEAGSSSNVTSADYDDFSYLTEHLPSVGPLANLVAVVLILTLYHTSERVQNVRYLWISMLFFMFNALLNLAKCYLYSVLYHLTFHHISLTFSVLTTLTSIVLVGLLIHVYLLRTRLGFQPVNRVDLKNVKYLHNYSNLLSRISFFWLTPLLHQGYKRPMEEEDLGELPSEEGTKYHFEKFDKIYQAEKETADKNCDRIRLWKCMFQTVWHSYVIGGVFRLLADCSGFVAPLGIKTIVQYASRNSTNLTLEMDGNEPLQELAMHLTLSEFLSNGYVMAVIILLSAILQSTFSQLSNFLVHSNGIHVKIALQTVIYKKALTLCSTKSSGSDSNGGSSLSLNEQEPEGKEARGDGKKSENKINGVKDDRRISKAKKQDSLGDVSEANFDTGSISNLMSEDTNNIMLFFWNAHFIWAIPLKILILMTLLYLQLGYSALAGAAVCIAIMIPLQYVIIAKYMSHNSKEMMERCDERLRAMSEILQGIKLLKLHGWELMFGERASDVRRKELGNLDRDMLYKSLMTFLTHISSVLMTVVTFGLYSVIEDEKLTSDKVFAGLALFNQLTVPLFVFPNTVPVVIEALVSVRRVIDYLSLSEATPLEQVERDESLYNKKSQAPASSQPIQIPAAKAQFLQVESPTKDFHHPIGSQTSDRDSVFHSSLESITEEIEDEARRLSIQTKDDGQVATKQEFMPVVEILDGNFEWDKEPDAFGENGLRNLNLKIAKGKLTVVVGSIGSGKSSLVYALLGEMKCTSGRVLWTTGTQIAYAGQKPWMLNATVRDNIVFGSPYRPKRYNKVVEACALEKDIRILPEQDDTEIGSKGINLSGGQKQRIAIARALYSMADVVILDDPLSALDVDVAQHVLEAGIRKFLGKSNRTVILVTHHLPVLRHAHQIVAMEKGSIRIQGNLEDIKQTDKALHAEWMDIMTKKEEEIQKQKEAKTAKERWALVKLISKIGLQFRNRGGDTNWKNVDDTQPLDSFRKRKGTFSHYKNLSNDMFSPNDEHHDELMTPLLRRRMPRPSKGSRTSTSSIKHPELMRMTSLQQDTSDKKRSPILIKKFSRLHSVPVDEEAAQAQAATVSPFTRDRLGTDGSQRLKTSMFRRMLSTKTRLSSVNSEPEKRSMSGSLRLNSAMSGMSDEDDDDDEIEGAILRQESSQEEREYGTIPWTVYKTYIGACGYLLSYFYLVISIGYEVIRVYNTFWLRRWSDEVGHASDEEYPKVMTYHFNVYMGLSLVTVLVSLTCNLLGKQAGANSREVMHRRMIQRVLRCPMRFFDSTPAGRIITRFSSDTALIDRKLSISMQRFLQFVFMCASALVVNAIANYWILVGAVPVVMIYYFFQRFFRFSSRELQRLEAISRGPIYSHFHETLEGLSTIRAYRVQERFTAEMIERIEANNRAAAFINVGNRWLSTSLDYIGSVMVFLAVVASLVSSELYPDVITPGMVGLAINYILLVPTYLNQAVKFLAEVEMFMNSVERVDRYSKLEIEDYGDDMDDSLDDWPSNGAIEYKNVSIRYGPDREPIVSGLNVVIPPKEKVGLCGRSGCGKSTLLMALFRVSDVCEGEILIDGKDIKELPLLKLRSKLSIIPQENILFTGSFRFNLDPAGKASDGDIWQALEYCKMGDLVRAIPGQLDGEVKDGGAAYSAGQKQLLGLARAIIHKSKVVIMDEATSSVDFATEKMLLAVVKEVFKESTVLTIAHRLEAIIEGNRVIVLDAGKIAEDGVPSVLRKKPLSVFATMLKHANQQFE